MLHPSWWQRCQAKQPFLRLGCGAKSGYLRATGTPWTNRKMGEGLTQLRSILQGEDGQPILDMTEMDLEQSLCEYEKFCRGLERHYGYINTRPKTGKNRGA